MNDHEWFPSFDSWCAVARSRHYQIHPVHFGTGGKLLYQAIETGKGSIGVFNITDNKGYLPRIAEIGDGQ